MFGPKVLLCQKSRKKSKQKLLTPVKNDTLLPPPSFITFHTNNPFFSFFSSSSSSSFLLFEQVVRSLSCHIYLHYLHNKMPGEPRSSCSSLTSASSSSSQQRQETFSFEHLEKIKKYIDEGWHTLTRSMTNTKDILRAFGDTKINTTPIVYFPFDFEIPSAFQTSCSSCIELRHLPCKIEKIGDFDPDTGLSHHGLLYLPHPYVVPGGMFNEMYGWDSYFIVRYLSTSCSLLLPLPLLLLS
jgi:neutral trehalase